MPLALITCHFNPQGYRSSKRNFLRFLRQLEAERVPVFIAELALGDVEWVLPESPTLFRLRTGSDQVLWFKENLLNLVERIVPNEFDGLAWVDADVWFERLDWYEATENALKKHAVVQMCDKVVRTREDGTVGRVQPTAAKVGSLAGHPGMAWAARRTLWTEGGGLYERAVIGSGDAVNSSVWLGDPSDLSWMGYQSVREDTQQQRAWILREGTCGYIDGTLWHEWHGDMVNRRHVARHQLLKGLDVRRHLVKREDGLLQWAPNAPTQVRRNIQEYFASRLEDGAGRDSNDVGPQPIRNV